MNSEEFDEALSLLVDDEISPQLFQKLQNHLAGSEQAQNDYLDQIKTHAVLSLELAPHALQVRSTKIISMERILERQKRRAIRWAVGVGAAAIVIATFFSVFVMLPEPPLASLKSSPLADLEITHSAADGKELHPLHPLHPRPIGVQGRRGQKSNSLAVNIEEMMMPSDKPTMRGSAFVFIEMIRSSYCPPHPNQVPKIIKPKLIPALFRTLD